MPPRPIFSTTRGLTLLAAAMLSPAGSAQDWLRGLRREVFDRIEVSGQRTIGFHSHAVDGDREAFDLLTNSGQGLRRVSDVGSMLVRGRRVLGALNFEFRVDTGRFTDPQSQRVQLTAGTRPLSVSAGDIQGSLLNTNRFASFSKLLRGATATYATGRTQVKALYSEARASARTVTLQGNNSAGPYYLQAGQIVRGTEQIRVDGEDQQLGTDYVINYEVGAITFVNRIVPPTSTIVATYEVLGFNRQRGTIGGVGATYDLGRSGRVGLTYLTQNSGGSSALSTRLERFQGAGAASTPYFLQFEPLLSRPVQVTLDGIPQTLGVDYRFDAENPTLFYFNRFVPLSSTIDVVYTPRPTQTLDGDRTVVGLDYQVRLGKSGQNGLVRYSQALGELKSSVNPLKGLARGVDGSYRSGRFEFRGAVRDVPRDYVSVESRSFNRNERATDLGLEMAFRDGTLSVDQSNASVSQRFTASDGDITFRSSRNTRLRGTVSYRPSLDQPWFLEAVQTRSRNQGTETRVDGLSLFTQRQIGRAQTRWGVQAQNARGPSTLGNETRVRDIELRTLRTEVALPASRAWTFSAQGSVSQVRTEGEESVGSDLRLGTTWEPSRRLSLGLNYTQSDSGSLASLGFENGFGVGYEGNGFSGGFAGTPLAVGATDVRRLDVTAIAQLTERLNLNLTALRSRSSGSITSNAETTAYDAALEYQAGGGLSMGVSLNQSWTEFLDSPQSSSSTNLDVYLIGSPRGPWSYGFRFGLLNTGGNSEFRQDGRSWEGSLVYRIDQRQSLLASLTDAGTSGYLGQNETFASVAYRYRILEFVALQAAYRFRDVRNRDSGESFGAYRARGLDVEFVFTFAPRS